MGKSARATASAARRASNRARGEARAYPRVRAKPVEPGTRCKLTRRCLDRKLFLTPDEHADDLRNFIGYSYGLAVRDTGVKLHAAVVLSNHHHTDISDPEGRRPQFSQRFNSLLARGINALRGRTGTFWDGSGPCDTRQPSDEETLEDLVYTLVNAVKAALVKHGDRWPGFTTYGWKFGEVRRFKRPRWFFDPENDELPEVVELQLERPNIYPEMSNDELYELLMRKVRAREREIHDELRQKNRRFMGETKLRRQRWYRTPRSSEDRFRVKPSVASSSKWHRIAQLQRDRRWERAYAKARESHRKGEATEFPHGTYWMRVHLGVKVANAPP